MCVIWVCDEFCIGCLLGRSIVVKMCIVSQFFLFFVVVVVVVVFCLYIL